ncbi:MAG: C25 family cysteine peptidase [Pirellulaceae bacterium]|nr:hypothetical protein [Planctomycetales bacterium]
MIATFILTLAPVLTLGPTPASVTVGDAPDTLIVAPPTWMTTMRPWLHHRRDQGHRMVVTDAGQSATNLRTVIRDVAQQGRLRFVVLVGDVPVAENTIASSTTIATHMAPSKVVRRWGSEPEIATDNWYADLDDDEVPDIAVGRLPVDTPQELAQVIEKLIQYEQRPPAGTWRRQVQLTAGTGDFGPVADAAIESVSKRLITDGIPPAYQTDIAYGSWRSPYCPSPFEFGPLALRNLHNGCSFWVYMGHANSYDLAPIRVPGGDYPLLSASDLLQLSQPHGLPVALVLACYAGAFDLPLDCLGEAMVKSPGGPVAFIGASRVTMPYAMAVMGKELMDAIFVQRHATLGEAVLASKRAMVADADDPARRFLDQVAWVISPERNRLAEERHEHVHLFNLLGDPLLRLPHAEEVVIDCPREAEPGSRIAVRMTSPVVGQAMVELVCRRDRSTHTLARRQTWDDTQAGLAAMNQQYRKANDRQWSVQIVQLQDRESTVELEVPKEAAGPCHVRAFVQRDRQWGIGSADIDVVRSDPQAGTLVGGTSPISGDLSSAEAEAIGP